MMRSFMGAFRKGVALRPIDQVDPLAFQAPLDEKVLTIIFNRDKMAGKDV
jgi:hypothetical protein